MRLSFVDAAVLAAAVLAASALLQPRWQRSRLWTATVTPLASIIGSGFLILAPLLLREFGRRAVWVMLGLCAIAYAVGAAIRWNILALDRIPARAASALALERISSWVLMFAYVISVTYYLNLFGAFSLSLLPVAGAEGGRIVTSAALLAIAALGWFRGLQGLERAEGLTVAIKLAVIAGLLAGLALHVAGLATRGAWATGNGHVGWHSLAIAFGLIITVQGFETSRYLGEAYPAEHRARTMRLAQGLSGAIYVAYIGLAGLAFPSADVPLRETAVIAMMAPVAMVLPVLLVVAALTAQMSAAVADTNGAGGLARELSRQRIPSRLAYLLLVALALVLTWSANIYEIISYASRAFALYYALQCGLAAMLARRDGTAAWRVAVFLLLAMLMLAAAAFGAPAE